MRVLRKLIVLGLAGLGVYKAWELLSPKVRDARDKTAQARSRVEPALRDAKDTLQSASRDAAGSVADASRDALGTVTDAVDDVGNEGIGGQDVGGKRDTDTRTPPVSAAPG